MKLTALLAEIEQETGPVLGIDLARRLGLPPSEVAAMLTALRASGRLGPETAAATATGDCSAAGACSMTCPGPDKCSMTIDLSTTDLEVRRPASRVAP